MEEIPPPPIPQYYFENLETFNNNILLKVSRFLSSHESFGKKRRGRGRERERESRERRCERAAFSRTRKEERRRQNDASRER